jgi:6-phosphogluconolactonase
MMTSFSKKPVIFFDDRRDLALPGDREATLRFASEHFVQIAQEAIQEKGRFSVALSGGETPHAIYQGLATSYRDQLDWDKVLLFWSDERCVPPNHPDSNYRKAMEAGLKDLPIPSEHIFRMRGEGDPEEEALAYEQLIQTYIPQASFDLVMLGMGSDGHTASLFPKTHGLHAENRLAIANYIPQLETWRLTLTFDCINNAQHIAIYVLGKSKAKTLKKVLTSPYNPDELPIQRVGTRKHKALWVVDHEAFQFCAQSDFCLIGDETL